MADLSFCSSQADDFLSPEIEACLNKAENSLPQVLPNSSSAAVHRPPPQPSARHTPYDSERQPSARHSTCDSERNGSCKSSNLPSAAAPPPGGAGAGVSGGGCYRGYPPGPQGQANFANFGGGMHGGVLLHPATSSAVAGCNSGAAMIPQNQQHHAPPGQQCGGSSEGTGSKNSGLPVSGSPTIRTQQQNFFGREGELPLPPPPGPPPTQLQPQALHTIKMRPNSERSNFSNHRCTKSIGKGVEAVRCNGGLGSGETGLPVAGMHTSHTQHCTRTAGSSGAGGVGGGGVGLGGGIGGNTGTNTRGSGMGEGGAEGGGMCRGAGGPGGAAAVEAGVSNISQHQGYLMSGPMPCLTDFEAYQRICQQILCAEDKQKVSGKTFIKKSGWRKLAMAFDISFEIRQCEITHNDQGNVRFASFIVRGMLPNGRFADAWGGCDSLEKRYSKPNHDIPATAETRAKNRACADLLGMKENTK